MKLFLAGFFTLSLFLVNPAMAQQPSSTFNETRSNVAQIIFGGLGGAILGLSTLSFYGRPQDHLSNVAVGFGLGILGGATYVATKNIAIIPTKKETIVSLKFNF